MLLHRYLQKHLNSKSILCLSDKYDINLTQNHRFVVSFFCWASKSYIRNIRNQTANKLLRKNKINHKNWLAIQCGQVCSSIYGNAINMQAGLNFSHILK